MKKEKRIVDFPRILLYVLEIVVLCLVISFFYFSMNKNQNYKGIYNEHSQKAVVEALVTSLELYNVHSVPYLGITPKIQLYIKDKSLFVNPYYLEIVREKIIIKDGETSEKDIIIRTTEDEIIKVVENASYMVESINSGKTIIEKATSNFVLFTKGYPDIFLK